MPVGRPSPTQGGLGVVRFMRARVIDVDSRRYTVTVLTEQENREYPDVQVASPYWHYQGEGFFSLPDLDARCIICIASDDTPPFILGYLDVPSLVTSGEMEAQSDLEQTQTSIEDAVASFSGAKPKANLGDVGIIGRDGNFSFWRKGGVVQEGASAFCQRIYIPVRNQIRDYAENYGLVTVGGDLLFESDRGEDSADGSVGYRVRLMVNELLEDKKASVYVGAGRLDGNVMVRVAVAPDSVDRSTGTVDSPVVDITFAKDGKVSVTTKNDLNVDVSGTLEETITGTKKTSVTGTCELSASDSIENMDGYKKITSPSITLAGRVLLDGQVSLGPGGGTQPICGNAIALQGWLTLLAAVLTTAGLSVPTVPNIVTPSVLA